MHLGTRRQNNRHTCQRIRFDTRPLIRRKLHKSENPFRSPGVTGSNQRADSLKWYYVCQALFASFKAFNAGRFLGVRQRLKNKIAGF